MERRARWTERQNKTVQRIARGIPVQYVLKKPVEVTEMDISLDSVVSSQSTSSVCSALSTISSASRDSVQEGSSSDRCVNISVIVMNVFCHNLLKKKLSYSVFISMLLIITVAAVVEVAL